MLQFNPGQFVFLHLLDEKGNSLQKKPYSIASAPEKPYLEFCIKMIDGAMTGKLKLLKVGDQIGVEGPLGHFAYKEEKTAAFIAGGSGIAPIISILRHISNQHLQGNFTLLYSSKTKDSIVYQKELENIQKNNPSIKIAITLTREEQPNGWKGELGRIDGKMISRYIKDPKTMDWWICGSMEMIKNMRQYLTEYGVDIKKVKFEGWG